MKILVACDKFRGSLTAAQANQAILDGLAQSPLASRAQAEAVPIADGGEGTLAVLLTALGVGLIVGLFQAATQIQEMTLSFIPKLLGMGVAFLIAGPWMLRLLVDFTRQLIMDLPNLIG